MNEKETLSVFEGRTYLIYSKRECAASERFRRNIKHAERRGYNYPGRTCAGCKHSRWRGALQPMGHVCHLYMKWVRGPAMPENEWRNGRKFRILCRDYKRRDPKWIPNKYDRGML